MVSIAQVAKMCGVGEGVVRGWVQRGAWGFPQGQWCNCGRHLLWDEIKVKRWKFKMLAQAITRRHPNQWAINRGLHLA